MNIVPLNNNALIAGAASNSLNLNTSVQSNASSSKDVASVSQIPSVNVTLSTQSNASAVVSASIPPIYSRVSIGAATTTQLSPSRNSSAPGVDQTSEAKITEFVQKNDSGKNESTNENTQQSVPDTTTIPDSTTTSGTTTTDTVNKNANQADPAKSGVNQEAPVKDTSADIGLSEQELKQISALQLRDQEVKAHELAHKSVGGQFTGSISLTYQSGPNGKRYAIGGEVPIDVSPVSGDPQATIAKMNIVRAAATAPADPSAQDQRVGAVASSILTQARSELVQKIREDAAARESEQAKSSEQNSNTPVSIPVNSSVSTLVGSNDGNGAQNNKNITIDAIV